MIESEQTELFRDRARRFARDRVAPHVAAWEAAFELPRTATAEMAALGYLEDYPVARFFRAIRATRIHEGIGDIQRMAITCAIAEETLSHREREGPIA